MADEARIIAQVEAGLKQLGRSMDEVRDEQRGIRRDLDDLLRRQAAEDARREARAEEDTQIRMAPGRVAEIVRRVEALEARPQVPTAIWADAQGRTVVWWVCVAAVLCSLALAGGLSFADLRPFVQPAIVEVPRPMPMPYPVPAEGAMVAP